MTNKFRFGAAGVALAAAFAMSTAAQAADSATATATAEVVQALTLVKDTDMDFGKVVVAGAGTVDVATDGSATCSANITCYSTTSAADFSITTGSIGKSVTVNLPTGPIDLIRAGAVDPGTGFAAADKIELDGFVTDATSNDILDTDGVTVLGQYYTVTLVDDGSGNGSAAFSIGGTITLDGSEVEGVYSNTFDVSVEYT
ncbi:MAG: DUF4402 domain-containing protein [Sphingomonadales bacterium]|nr:DUF4402 domain-containing protein [Sphingomonadales bacterium]MBD3773612.1 DUF4402 domain-containing protein [Paracoccaceae bacterium]